MKDSTVLTVDPSQVVIAILSLNKQLCGFDPPPSFAASVGHLGFAVCLPSWKAPVTAPPPSPSPLFAGCSVGTWEERRDAQPKIYT